MKVFYFFLLVLVTIPASAQRHYQMISSIGSTSSTANNVVVTQTIGQQSVVGNFVNRNYTLGQGYQKPIQSKRFVFQPYSAFDLDVYPNPFNQVVNLRYNTTEDVNVSVFDSSGKIVFQYTINDSSIIKTINLAHLSDGFYTLYLYSPKLNFYKKLIKK